MTFLNIKYIKLSPTNRCNLKCMKCNRTNNENIDLKIKYIENTGPNHMSVNANIDFYKELIAKIDAVKPT